MCVRESQKKKKKKQQISEQIISTILKIFTNLLQFYHYQFACLKFQQLNRASTNRVSMKIVREEINYFLNIEICL